MNALPFPCKSLGYAQFAAGGVDTSTLVSTATFGSNPVGIPIGTTFLLITCAAQAIRWRDDDTAPTAAVGYPLAVGTELVYSAGALPQLRLIAQVAGAVVNMVAYGSGP
jgi:hypothetical protein